MQDLLVNPAVQAGVIPFIVALVTIVLLRPLGWFWSGLAFIVAFYVMVYLTIGFQITPLTSTRKIILLGGIACIAGLVLDVIPLARKYVLGLLAVLSAGAVLWVLWPVMVRKEAMDLVIMALTASLYCVWLSYSVENSRLAQPQIFAGTLALGIGTGVSALLGASALSGQFGGAVGAAAGAYIVVNLLNKDTPVGTSFTFPAALLSGLIGIAAVVYADLPWYSLIPIALIPVLLHIHIPPTLSKQKKLLLMCVLTLAPALVAIILTWQVAGAPPI